MEPEAGGYHSCVAAGAGADTLYRFRFEGELRLFPDPASRFQPEGPEGPSQVVDPSRFAWTDQDWRGIQLQGQVKGCISQACGAWPRSCGPGLP